LVFIRNKIRKKNILRHGLTFNILSSKTKDKIHPENISIKVFCQVDKFDNNKAIFRHTLFVLMWNFVIYLEDFL